MRNLVLWIAYAVAALGMITLGAVAVGRRQYEAMPLCSITGVVFAWCSGVNFADWALQKRLTRAD